MNETTRVENAGQKLQIATSFLFRKPWTKERTEGELIGGIATSLSGDSSAPTDVIRRAIGSMVLDIKRSSLEKRTKEMVGRFRNLAATITVLFPAELQWLTDCFSQHVHETIAYGTVLGVLEEIIFSNKSPEVIISADSVCAPANTLANSLISIQNDSFFPKTKSMPSELSGDLSNMIAEITQGCNGGSTNAFVRTFLEKGRPGDFPPGSLQEQIWDQICTKFFMRLPLCVKVGFVRGYVD